MQISDLLWIMRQLIDLQEKKKREKKKRTFGIGWKIQPVAYGPIWVKKSGAFARESNRGRGDQITERYHWDTEEFRSNWVKDLWKVNFKWHKVPVLDIHPVP